MVSKNVNIVERLQSDILRLQGFKPASHTVVNAGLGPILQAFPNQSFPLGCIHEFIAAKNEDRSATTGFLSALLSQLMGNGGIVVWIGTGRKLFPPALKTFGVSPDRFIFIDVKKEQDVLWAMEEALKCSACTAVVAEVNDLQFTASRRLQLAVEESKVTGFVLGKTDKNTTACVSRWRITSEPSFPIDDGLPGVGYPIWKIELLRIRNGKPGCWYLQWKKNAFDVFTSKNVTQRSGSGDDFKQAG